MAFYQRMTIVNAVQFFEEEYDKDGLNYPDVWDRAMFSEIWMYKTAEDGRYYIQNQPNTNSGQNEYVTVNNGDYIIREEMGVVYVLPQELFERHYEKLSE